MTTLREKFVRLREFVLHDVWSIELAGASGARGFVSRLIRVAQLVVRGYREDDLPIHAAALTFSFLMSLVPLLAIASAILKGLGAGKQTIDQLPELSGDALPVQGQEFLRRVVEIVDSTNFVALGWVGVVVLFVTVVQVLASVEDTFNKIWGVRKRRTWWQRFTNYTSLTIVVPVLVAAAFALSASARAGLLRQAYLAGFVGGLLKLAPLFTTWLAFFLLYSFMPNTRVQKRASVVGALAAALLWIGWQKSYLYFQFGLSNYNAIYGTFASIPVFLFWVFVGWTIILLGAEFCFALQNQSTYHLERVAGSASVRARLTLALGLLAEAAETFRRGTTVFDAEAFGHARHVPIRLVNDMTRLLCRGGLLLEVADRPGWFALQRTPDRIAASDLFDLVLQDGTGSAALGLGRDLHPAVNRAIAAWSARGADAFAGQSLADLVAADH